MPFKKSEKNRKTGRKMYSENINRIFLVLPLIAVLGLVVAFADFRLAIKEVQFEYFKGAFEASTRQKLRYINKEINEMVVHLESTAKTINEYSNFWDPDVKKILKLSCETSKFTFMAVADEEGNGYDNEGNSFNVAQRAYFRTALKGQVAFSDVISSKIFDGNDVQVIAHPLRTPENKVRGVVFGVCDIKDMEKMNSQKSDEYDGKICIVDSRGTYIAQFQGDGSLPSDDNFWSDVKRSALDDEQISQIKSDFEKRKEGGFSYTSEGEKLYVCYMPIGPNKWQLVYTASAAPMDNIVASIYRLDNRNVLFAGACYVILILCIIWHFKRANNEIRNAHQEAERNMEFMRISIEHSKHIVFEYDQANKELHLKTDIRNPMFQHTVMRYVPECFWSMNIIAPGSMDALKQLFETIKTESSSQAEIEIVSDSDPKWYRISMDNIYNRKNEIIDTVGVVEDISNWKKQEAKMLKKLQIQNTLIAKALLYARVDLKAGTLMELNGEEIQMSYDDFLTEKIIAEVSEEHVPYAQRALSLETLRKTYQQGNETVEVQFPMECGHSIKWVSCAVYQIYMEDNSKVLFVIKDIDSRKREEIALKEQAERDGLTGLYNAATTRAKINEILSLKHILKDDQIFVLIDLDNYKQINDTFGHGFGDQVLIDIAKILNARFRSSDIVGRLGGDEFILLLREMKSRKYAEHVIEELSALLCRTYREGGKEVMISASIGIAVAPTDGCTFEELYKKSDMAQYQVKKETKNGYRFYQQQ